MSNNIPNEEDPEEKKGLSEPDQKKDEQPAEQANSVFSLFDLSEDTEVNNFLQANMENDSIPFSDFSRNSDQTSGKTKDLNAEADKAVPDPDHQGDEFEASGQVTSAPAMDGDVSHAPAEPTESDLLNDQINSLRQELESKPEVETPEQKPKPNWFQKLVQNPQDGLPSTPPFWVDENISLDDDIEKQAEKIMASLPEPVPELTQEQNPSGKNELNWQESDSRLADLQEIFGTPATPEVKPRISVFKQLKTDFDRSGPLIKGITISVLAFAVILAMFIVYSFFSASQEIREPAAPTASQLPYPIAVQFPGGWSFSLNRGGIKNGIWMPATAEWLEGTEISRLVSIPWSKQLESVYLSIAPGDIFLLGMSNGDQLSYKVESTQEINSDQLNQLVNRNSPSLVVVLTKPDTKTRQIVIANMDLSRKPVLPTP